MLEIYTGNSTIEIDDLLDVIAFFTVEGNKLFYKGDLIAEYVNHQRAEDVYSLLVKAVCDFDDSFTIPRA